MSCFTPYQPRKNVVLLHSKRQAARDRAIHVKESSMYYVVTLTLTLLLAVPSLAQDKPSLRDVKEIEDPLFAVAVASEVADVCDSIAPRYWKGFGVLRRLRARANQLGYSDDEIRDYVESREEKNRMRRKGEILLKQSGVDLNKPETFCTYGLAEIEKNSAIGALLRAK